MLIMKKNVIFFIECSHFILGTIFSYHKKNDFIKQ